MPSPLAHASLILLAAPTLPAPRHRAALIALAVVFLLLPDADIAVGIITTGDAFANHGSWSHSFVIAPLAGLAFAFMARAIAGIGFARGLIVGTSLYASHVALDALTHGRGVAMLWPISPERIISPVQIFSGVRHSEPGNIAAHARTLAEESLFAIAVGAAAFALARRRAAREPTP